MNRRRNLFIILGIVLVAVVIGVVAQPHKAAPTVAVTTVAFGTFQTKLPETGVLQRPEITTLPALVPGNIQAINVRPGQRVSQGQVLATLTNPQLENAAQDADDAYAASVGRMRTATSTNAVLPAQNRSAVEQAEQGLEQARFALNGAIQDQRSGAQSGLGYGGSSAAQQRAAADAGVATAQTDYNEAQRIATADQDLFDQKALSRDALATALAHRDQTRVALDQAQRTRNETYAQIQRQQPVLGDRVRAARDAVTQAEAQLTAARQNAAQDKGGDVVAAQADMQQRAADRRYADDQLARLRIVAPFSGVIQTVGTETGDSLRPLQPGDPVAIGQALVTIAADAGFVVRTKVDEQDVSAVHPGQAALVSGEDLGTTSLPAHVTVVGAVAQKSDDPSNTSRQVLTTVALDRTLPYLRDGMTVDVDLLTHDLHNVLVVPNTAVRHDAAGKPFVLAIVHNVTQKRAITVDATNDTTTVVRRGVHAGDRLVNEQTLSIVDGLTVEPSSSPSARP